MNFATLQGLTIPEGVVTQITDASGRVLWKSGPSVVTVILRPTADISVTHSVYPAGSAAYSCIDEEVADGDATYIYGTANTTDIKFSGVIPDGMTVVGAKAVYVGKYKDNNYQAVCSVAVIGADNNGVGSAAVNIVSESYAQFIADGDDAFVSALNALGNGNVSVPIRMLSAVGNSANKDAKVYITQMYLELTCEG